MQTDPIEIIPGVWHWTKRHPRIGIDVSSYLVAEPRVALDPMLPPWEGLGWFGTGREPRAIVLTNRHHWRESGPLVEAFGCPVRASRPGLHEFSDGRPVQGFDFGDELEGGIVAHEVGAICPDDTALHMPEQHALALADGLIRGDGGPVSFVPDSLMDDPPGTKAGLLDAFERLLELDFDHLLLAHGSPLVGEGRAALRAFVEHERERAGS